MTRPVFRLKEGVSLVLASGSPRRREFVAGWGVPFTQRTADSEPRPEEGEEPLAYVVRSAEAKLAASRPGSCELVIAADTVVVHGGKIIGKPRSDSEALAMLQELCGSEHHVATGVALAFPDGIHKAFAGQLRRALCALGRSVPEGLCGHRRMPGQSWCLRHTGAGRFSGGKHQRVLEYSGWTAHRKGDPDFRHGRLASSGSVVFSVLRRPAWGFDSIHKSFVKRGMGHHEGVEAASGILSHEQQFC